mmetsp:Transcript_58392/g.173791  ORF Transcript_58392/g.173791 Transcript_58392/m.173791 type:complete len:232 (+) Transcript_58392:46-741(+)
MRTRWALTGTPQRPAPSPALLWSSAGRASTCAPQCAPWRHGELRCLAERQAGGLHSRAGRLPCPRRTRIRLRPHLQGGRLQIQSPSRVPPCLRPHLQQGHLQVRQPSLAPHCLLARRRPRPWRRGRARSCLPARRRPRPLRAGTAGCLQVDLVQSVPRLVPLWALPQAHHPQSVHLPPHVWPPHHPPVAFPRPRRRALPALPWQTRQAHGRPARRTKSPSVARRRDAHIST